jgi:hypothetical protein
MTDISTASLTHPGSTEMHHEVVRLGSARGGWFRRVGWRHVVAVLALAFSLFPILFMVCVVLGAASRRASGVPRCARGHAAAGRGGAA